MFPINRYDGWTIAAVIFSLGLETAGICSCCHAGEQKPDERMRQAIEPLLARCTLESGRQIVKPDNSATPSRWEYRVGERRIAVEQDKVYARTGAATEPVWTAKSAGGQQLQWVGAEGNHAYLVPYKVDARGHFQGYVTPLEVLRLDLEHGQWLAALPGGTAKGMGGKPGQVVSLLAGDGYVAVLTTLLGAGKDDEAVIAYEVNCYRAGKTTPLWTKTFPTAGERPRPGAYLLSTFGPEYATSALQHLSWLGDTLLVCAEAVQPILCLNRDTGTKLWQLERPWEFERGFIGPSVWQHYLARFALDHFSENPKRLATAREAFDKTYHGAIIGGPVVVPLGVERENDSHSIFVAVSKAAADGFSGYTADCILYEFNDRAKPVAMLKLPQTVQGGRFQRQKGGLVWKCQNETFLKVVFSHQLPERGMGPGGPDCLLRTPWLRQLTKTEPRAWLAADRSGDPVTFSDSHAFCLPAGGYVTHEDRFTYHFPLTAIDLRTGVDLSLLLHVPFQGKLPEPKTNFRETNLQGGGSMISTYGPYLLAVTRLHAEGTALEITLGMEGWSSQLRFDLGKIEGLRSARAEDDGAEAIRAWVKSLGDVNKPDKNGNGPLSNKAHDVDARYVKALLEAGADAKTASKHGWTALMTAATYGTAEVVQVLIDAGSDVNARDNNCGGQTILMWASRSGRESKRKVQALLKAGANPKATLDDGWNVLMSASMAGNLATVELLLEVGLDAAARTKDGETALMRAATLHDAGPELLRVLLKAGAAVNAKDNEGRTVLIHAAEGYGTGELMQVLLDAGADPGAKDAKGRTALEILRSSNNGGAKERAQVLEAFLKRP